MTDLAALPRRTRFQAVNWTSKRLRLYDGSRKLKRQTDHLIRRDTDIVIERHPTSASGTTALQFLAMAD